MLLTGEPSQVSDTRLSNTIFCITLEVLATVWPKWSATCEARVLVCVQYSQSARAAAFTQSTICVRRTITEITVATGQLSSPGPSSRLVKLVEAPKSLKAEATDALLGATARPAVFMSEAA